VYEGIDNMLIDLYCLVEDKVRGQKHVEAAKDALQQATIPDEEDISPELIALTTES
jgi:hypothetical protein